MPAPRDYTFAQLATSARLLSLDVFRGLTMAAMVIVNNPGDWGNVYGPLLHAPWHGLTPTDLIFPFFLFIVGVSIPLAQRSSASYAAIGRRAAIIFGLGMLLALYPRFDFATVRIPGVLQRIAVCYLVMACVHRFASTDGTNNGERAFGALVGTLLLSHMHWTWINEDLSPEGNIGARIDRAIYGDHLWRQTKTWDPEGLVSTVPAIATTSLGLAAGYVLTSHAYEWFKQRALLVAGAAFLIVGWAWSFLLPLNKSLWTGSYVFVTGGLALMLLGVLRWALDRDQSHDAFPRRLAQPFVILGRNALLLFVVSGFLAKTLGLVRFDNEFYRNWLVPFFSPKNASLLYAFLNLAVLFALLWWLHRRRWYFRV